MAGILDTVIGINPNQTLRIGGMSGTQDGGLLGMMNNPLLGLAAGLLAGSEPGGTFAGGLNQGLNNMQGMQHAALQGSLLKARLDEIEQEKARRAKWAAAVGNPGTEPTPYQMSDAELFPGEQQIPGLLNAGQDPTGMYKSDPGMAQVLGLLDPEIGQQFVANAALQGMKPAEVPNEIRELEYYMQNPQLFQMAQELKRAGASNTSISPKIELKMGESIANQVGPIVKGTYDSAVAGAKLVDSSQRIIQAVDKGNAIVGPTANIRLKGAQIADVLGVGGKDNAEKISNTRAIIRATAEQAVSARSMLGGQAQISNAEQELITKATAGDIADLTMGELRQIAEVSDRLGRQMYASHQDKLRVLNQNPETATMAPYYQPPEILPEYKPQSGGVKFLGFE